MLNFLLKFRIKHAKPGKHYFFYYGNGKKVNRFIINLNREFYKTGKIVNYYSQVDDCNNIHMIEAIIP